jgi:hypothetical protein
MKAKTMKRRLLDNWLEKKQVARGVVYLPSFVAADEVMLRQPVMSGQQART